MKRPPSPMRVTPPPLTEPLVDGDVLAEGAAAADLEARGLARVGALLRVAAEHRERVHHVARPQPRPLSHHGVRVEARPRPERHAGLDHGERAHRDVGAGSSTSGATTARGCTLAVLHARARRYSLIYGWRSTMEASSSPSAQRAPSTLASPRSFHTLERWWSTSTWRSRRSPGVTVWRNFALSMPREEHQVRGGIERVGRVGEDAADLRQALEDEHARHDGSLREVPGGTRAR